MMVDTLHEHSDTVFSSDMRRVTIVKKEIWAIVAQKVSAVGNTPHTTKDCRKWWDDLRLRVRSILSANRSQALETRGGPGSPMKMMLWEETCAAMIGPEAIEEVGDMECGATSSVDGGSEHDSEDQAGNWPSTSRGQVRARRLPASRKTPQATPPAPTGPMEDAQPLLHPALVQDTCPTLQSEETSVAGENAATGPLNVPNSPSSVCGATEEDTDVIVHTPDAQTNPQVSYSDSSESDTPGHTGQAATLEHASPVSTSLTEATEIHANPVPGGPTTSATLAMDAERSEQLTAFINEFIQDNRKSSEEWRNELRALGEVITSSTNRLCEVLDRIADALEAAPPARQPQQEDKHSQSSSTQTSPLRRSQRTLHRRDMDPPGSGSAH
ncbi:uncharacterized protein [Ambystoma mexicanum]|uniref:uncharacterized protein n=1 Tax=Ambystoma mexicanum TaxID=8296 RepID=UPI0037E79C38